MPKRFWKTYPPQRRSLVFPVCVLSALVLLTAAIVILFFFVLDLRTARSHQAADQQRAIDGTFCHVLAQLPAASPELARIRHDLRCTQPGLSPDQVRQMTQTGGTP